jgi:hypothetical protein
MSRPPTPTAAEERAALETMRRSAELLLRSTDLLLRPQYLYLAGRIEALIAICDGARPAEDRQ